MYYLKKLTYVIKHLGQAFVCKTNDNVIIKNTEANNVQNFYLNSLTYIYTNLRAWANIEPYIVIFTVSLPKTIYLKI